jgi:hypothetical protein
MLIAAALAWRRWLNFRCQHWSYFLTVIVPESTILFPSYLQGAGGGISSHSCRPAVHALPGMHCRQILRAGNKARRTEQPISSSPASVLMRTT